MSSVVFWVFVLVGLAGKGLHGCVVFRLLTGGPSQNEGKRTRGKKEKDEEVCLGFAHVDTSHAECPIQSMYL